LGDGGYIETVGVGATPYYLESMFKIRKTMMKKSIQVNKNI
jgi:hypothetical protein